MTDIYSHMHNNKIFLNLQSRGDCACNQTQNIDTEKQVESIVNTADILSSIVLIYKGSPNSLKLLTGNPRYVNTKA